MLPRGRRPIFLVFACCCALYRRAASRKQADADGDASSLAVVVDSAGGMYTYAQYGSAHELQNNSQDMVSASSAVGRSSAVAVHLGSELAKGLSACDIISYVTSMGDELISTIAGIIACGYYFVDLGQVTPALASAGWVNFFGGTVVSGYLGAVDLLNSVLSAASLLCNPGTLLNCVGAASILAVLLSMLGLLITLCPAALAVVASAVALGSTSWAFLVVFVMSNIFNELMQYMCYFYDHGTGTVKYEMAFQHMLTEGFSEAVWKRIEVNPEVASPIQHFGASRGLQVLNFGHGLMAMLFNPFRNLATKAVNYLTLGWTKFLDSTGMRGLLAAVSTITSKATEAAQDVWYRFFGSSQCVITEWLFEDEHGGPDVPYTIPGIIVGQDDDNTKLYLPLPRPEHANQSSVSTWYLERLDHPSKPASYTDPECIGLPDGTKVKVLRDGKFAKGLITPNGWQGVYADTGQSFMINREATNGFKVSCRRIEQQRCCNVQCDPMGSFAYRYLSPSAWL